MRKPTVTPFKTKTGAATEKPLPAQGARKSDNDRFSAEFKAARGTI